jgi:acylphosphatase
VQDINALRRRSVTQRRDSRLLDNARVKRQRVVVRGQVQGVFFRDTCRRRASEAGVAGWVRNRSDGALEAVFEGDDAAVDDLVTWCWSGPPSAIVESVEVTDEEPVGETGFSVS